MNCSTVRSTSSQHSPTNNGQHGVVADDAVYASAFKCGHRLVARSPNLEAWMRDVYLVAGVAGTVDVDGYRTSYFGPMGTIPPGFRGNSCPK